MENRILVTGGTGLIGKYLQNEMPNASYVGSSDYNLTKNDEVIKMFKDIKPNIVIHLAAQPLVLDSYKNPHKTFNTNIIGTLNLLEAARDINSIKVIIIVTTDKVYKIKKNNPFYNEKNILGASDPYGTSKACVEFLSETYKYSFFKKRKLSISPLRLI